LPSRCRAIISQRYLPRSNYCVFWSESMWIQDPSVQMCGTFGTTGRILEMYGCKSQGAPRDSDQMACKFRCHAAAGVATSSLVVRLCTNLLGTASVVRWVQRNADSKLGKRQIARASARTVARQLLNNCRVDNNGGSVLHIHLSPLFILDLSAKCATMKLNKKGECRVHDESV
jgi:hypothetical protein